MGIPIGSAGLIAGIRDAPAPAPLRFGEWPLAITVTVDEADSNHACIQVTLDGGTGLLRIEIQCGGVTSLAPVPMVLWVVSLSGAPSPVEVTIDQPTTVSGSGGSRGSTTVITLTREKD